MTAPPARNLAAKRYHSFARETGIEELDEEPADRHEPMAQVLDNELA